MNPVLIWTRKNWPVIVCGVVIVGSMPTAWYFSNQWNKKIKATQQSAATSEIAKTNIKVVYTVPGLIPGQPDFTLSDVPNDEITKRFDAIKKELAKQTKAVIDRVTAFNRGVGTDAQAVQRIEHTVLVPDLFPGPTQAKVNQAAFPGKSDAEIAALPAEKGEPRLESALRDMIEPGLRQMEDKLLGKRGNADPYEALVRAANAGAPPSAGEVLLAVQDKVQREKERMITQQREPTPEEQQKLNVVASNARLGRYQSATQGFSVYMTRESLGAVGAATTQQGQYAPPSGQGGGLRIIPGEATFRTNTALLNDKDLFLFQWDQWIISDTIAAVRLVNTSNGQPTSVENSVVKRIDRLAALAFPALESVGSDQRDANGNLIVASTTPATPGAEVKPDYRVSITGRTTSPTNADYDVRNAVIVAIVSSERLPQFLDALTRANFNAVIQVQLSEVDVKGDIEKGYYYGSEHVVRATITLESVWLRNWVGALMPASVKRALGVAEPTPAPEAK